ncbi:MAG: hypothetical protein M1833_002757 [Piccolia ochrophora]|nr:MAG: hypothetical protein M1833_002757 [Piccolia ochrophora]
MGIKGIFAEIGPGDRIALSKLAADHFAHHERPLRIAVDISIWNFQVQSGKGGHHPELRTLYYRLLRFLSLGIYPIFVFDGPNKPLFKRNKRTTPSATSIPGYLKRLLDLIGFPYHAAPGEAEAECALLQQEGIVDAVLSEDVDTLMFGCGLTMRNWSSENTRGSKSPTHVNIYHADTVSKRRSGLSPAGMVLIAMISGGDYITAGVPGFGIKAACEAARAGFGESICRLTSSDKAGIKTWRDNLAHEFQTNESSFFRTRHKAFSLPDDFPDMQVLRYYTHPAVSDAETITQLKSTIRWDVQLDVAGLRAYVADMFGWENRGGAIKYIRTLAPALLVSQILHHNLGHSSTPDTHSEDQPTPKTTITARRISASSDGIPELRLTFIPTTITEIDLSAEPVDEPTNPTRTDDAHDSPSDTDLAPSSTPLPTPTPPTPSKRPRAPKPPYDPTNPHLTWLPSVYVSHGIPAQLRAFEDAEAARTLAKGRKPGGAGRRGKGKTLPANQATLDQFLKVVKRPAEPGADVGGEVERREGKGVGEVVGRKEVEVIVVDGEEDVIIVDGEEDEEEEYEARVQVVESRRTRRVVEDVATGSGSKRSVVLRESLEGAWREVDGTASVQASQVWEGVDTLDLTK